MRDVPVAVLGDADRTAFLTGVFEVERMSVRLLDEAAIRFEFVEEFEVRRSTPRFT